MSPVELRDVATRDIRGAASWYAGRNAEIGERFLDEVTRTLDLIERFPMTGAPVPGIDDKTFADCPCTTFHTTLFS